jgi:hypothetical protein
MLRGISRRLIQEGHASIQSGAGVPALGRDDRSSDFHPPFAKTAQRQGSSVILEYAARLPVRLVVFQSLHRLDEVIEGRVVSELRAVEHVLAGEGR